MALDITSTSHPVSLPPSAPFNRSVPLTHLPERMTSLSQWVVSGPDKIPLDPKTHRRADTTNPTTWTDYATACRVATVRGLNLGFVFTKASRIVGVDLDKCRNPETGDIEPWAQAIVQRLNTLTEISRSGTGVHLFAESDELPEGGRKRGPIEMYDSGRHFLMTGNLLPGYVRLASRTDELKALHADVFTKPDRPTPPPPSAPLTLDTEAVLDRIRRSDKGRRLHDSGDWKGCGYPSQSEADQALTNLYAAAGASRNQADDLFRRAGLWRPKWDQRRGDRTYGEKTLDRAFDGSVTPWATALPIVAASPQSLSTTCDADPCGDVRRENLRLRAELDQVKAERDDLQQTVDTLRFRIEIADQRVATYQNNDLGSAKAVASGLIEVFAANTPKKPNQPASYRVPLSDLSKITGLSEDACSRQVKQLAKYTIPDSETPIIHVDVADVGGLDRETGELIAPHKQMWIGPGVPARAFGELVSTVNPKAKPQWGGKREDGVCVDHPDDGVIERVRYQKTVTYECATCRHLLQETTTPVASKRSTAKHLTHIPTPHDAAWQETTDPDLPLMPHHADTLNVLQTPSVVVHYPGKMRHRADVDSGPDAPDWLHDAPDDSIAARWGRGQPLPGFESSPPDRYTDVSIGGRS